MSKEPMAPAYLEHINHLTRTTMFMENTRVMLRRSAELLERSKIALPDDGQLRAEIEAELAALRKTGMIPHPAPDWSKLASGGPVSPPLRTPKEPAVVSKPTAAEIVSVMIFRLRSDKRMPHIPSNDGWDDLLPLRERFAEILEAERNKAEQAVIKYTLRTYFVGRVTASITPWERDNSFSHISAGSIHELVRWTFSSVADSTQPYPIDGGLKEQVRVPEAAQSAFETVRRELEEKAKQHIAEAQRREMERRETLPFDPNAKGEPYTEAEIREMTS
ncbi:hypothetical protein KEU06_09520 [Pseudaminobacter sp. 19-2017]|uniref:Uncharacterized protein n=1 Tax=Pseudaminobacter soli (ex Zhang et al. 2022) TaxID=2831468 RepID=A0A942I2T1_9HYPH|nr:hypothetical protein [Pseudaminobacter soli]MBS3648844.1 hypothetical protein [Pseudaminobacter soli]